MLSSKQFVEHLLDLVVEHVVSGLRLAVQQSIV